MNKPVHTRTFKSGNSVAVRLPKGFAIPEGAEVQLDKTGDTVTIRLARDPAEEKARMLKWLDELYALPKPPRVQKREPILFPKRRGL
jgi:antitoxin VapB